MATKDPAASQARKPAQQEEMPAVEELAQGLEVALDQQHVAVTQGDPGDAVEHGLAAAEQRDHHHPIASAEGHAPQRASGQP
jgi:hypothetical protein